ncbi:MAG: Methylthioribulose-1-phosphate dehydratase [Vezdaea aestivalis]|nr:MAG: Methylthioribulose-1-phosphate dehydratase [Vezdaea aestivalis]
MSEHPDEFSVQKNYLPGSSPEDAAFKANPDLLIQSTDPDHPANIIPRLCRNFYNLGWVTGTGGGISIRKGNYVFIAPSGVQKELLKAEDLFVMLYSPDITSRNAYYRSPPNLKPSACTPLFLAAFNVGAYASIHTHSQWAVLVTLIVEREFGRGSCFEINHLEQIKGIPRGLGKTGNLGFHDTLKIPIIENTAHEEDLTSFLVDAIKTYPDSYAVLVRRHGIYVWGDTVAKAKTSAESLDYIFQLAVEMNRLGFPWITEDK